MRTIDIRTARNVYDKHNHAVIENLVDNSVRPPTSTPKALKFALQRLAYASRVSSEVTVYEFDNGRNNSRRDSLQISTR